MKRMSIQDLKAQLSSAIAEAESGGTIVITRHNRPVAQLTAASQPHVHVAGDASFRALVPAIKRGTKGRYLAVLRDDRDGR
jgi:prevent-host-death family protein